MTLCALCTGLRPDVNQYHHHASASELAASANQCELCQLIHGLLDKSGQLQKAIEYKTMIDGKYELLNDTSITISANRHTPPAPDKKPQQPYQLVVSCGPLTRGGFFSDNEVLRAPTIALGIFANEGEPPADVILTRPVTTNCDDSRTFNLIQHWISSCVEEHDECLLGYMKSKAKVSSDSIDELKDKMRLLSEHEETPLPTRVLDVGADGATDSIRLLETNGTQGLYVALSHCWGSSRHQLTTTSTLKDRLSNIAFDDLAKTFKDAITITRRLGYRYLWIDSLCIIQDDLLDWERESSLMGNVYRNAHFTIAAAASVDGDGGCLSARLPSSRNAIAIPFSPASSSSSASLSPPEPVKDSFWYVYEESGSYSKSVWQAPLQQRVWTLQERCLSRRILHFAHDQIYFECNRSTRFEDGKPESKHTSDYVNFSTLYSMKTKRFPAFRVLTEWLLSRQWVMLIESVMDRKLTNEEDMLPALSGVTSQLHEITSVEFTAGLLQGSRFPDMLLWRVTSYWSHQTQDSQPCRPKAYRAPSWSWASVTVPVHFATGGYEPLEPLHHTDLLEQIDIQVQPQGTDPNGRIRSGTLGVTSWLFPIEVLGTDPDRDFDEPSYLHFASFMYRARSFSPPNTVMSGYTYVRTKDHSFWGTAALDEKGRGLGDGDGGGHIYAFFVKEKEEKANKEMNEQAKHKQLSTLHMNSFFVLFLEPATGDGVSEPGEYYRRVGMGHLVQTKEVDFGAKTSITII